MPQRAGHADLTALSSEDALQQARDAIVRAVVLEIIYTRRRKQRRLNWARRWLRTCGGRWPASRFGTLWEVVGQGERGRIVCATGQDTQFGHGS